MTQYSGKIIRKNAVVPTQQSASGVWTVTDAAAATRNNAWPVAGVPDPISRSSRFRASASAYYNRTPAVAGNQKTWTWSSWVKRGALSTAQYVFAAGTSGSSFATIGFTSSNTLTVWSYIGGNVYELVTTQVFRDPSAWYHIVVAFDTTQATSSNRIKVYVNGIQVTAFGTSSYPSLNYDTLVNSTTTHAIGQISGFGSYFDGYMTEINLVDGQQLTPSSFGTTDQFTGAWVPMTYTGTYGTNGFYLNFKDNTSTTTLGYDYSGNSNNWTANNISLTAGVTYDSMLDVPTPWIGYNTDGGVSVTRGNYATLNPIDKSANATVSAGNLQFTISDLSAAYLARASMVLPTSGKWYWEVTNITASPYQATIGLCNAASPLSAITNTYSLIYGTTPSNAIYYTNGSSSGAWSGITTPTGANNVLMIAFDADNRTMWMGRNGSWYNSSGTANPATNTDPRWSSIPTNIDFVPFVLAYYSTYASLGANFGQRPFSYTPPTGFKALCTTNLPEPTIKLGAQYFAASTYTGNGTSQDIVNSGNNTTSTTFQPDFVWIKKRSSIGDHVLDDSVRGAGKGLFSNLTNAENASMGGFLSFNSNGWSMNGTIGEINSNGATFVGWQWKANGASVSNTDGTITSQVSAGTTQGFSVVTYTGNGVTSATVGHGLGVTPAMIIVKSRSTTTDWFVRHQSLTTGYQLRMNSTLPQEQVSSATTNGGLGSGTSSVINFISGSTNTANVNASGGTFIAYCFAEVSGYSKAGSWVGNGSADGTFVYCGFRPRYVMYKNRTSSGSWQVLDTSRSTYNAVNSLLYPDLADAQDTSTNFLDFLSNGFKMRSSSYGNGSGDTYVFMAFAETPFKYSNAR